MNNLQDNRFMGKGQYTEIRTLGELREKLKGLSDTYKLTDDKGNRLLISIGDNGLVIEPALDH